MKTKTLFFITLIALVSTGRAFANEAQDSNEVSVTLGGSLNRGNSETEHGDVAIEVLGDIDSVGAYKLGAQGNITRVTTKTESVNSDGTVITTEKDETSVENGEVSGRLSFPVRGPFEYYFEASAFADSVADVDYRFIVGPGLTYNLLKKDNITVSFDFGISPMWEKIDGESEFYTAARLGQTVSYSFANGSKIWEAVEYYPTFDTHEKYLINAEIGVESPLNDLLSLRIVLTESFNSCPAEGKEKNDLALVAGVRIKL